LTGGSDRRVRLSVIGAGYLGLTHAVCMAELGHNVLVVDVDTARIAQAAGGTSPFFEPGLEPLLRKNLDAGRLGFTTCHGDAATFGDVHFLCVGTPQAPDGSADLSQVYAAADALAPHLIRPCVIAGKSTVPVGTGRALARRIAERAPAGAGAKLAWNPEFLREGSAVQDSLLPDRIVLGVASQQSAEMPRRVYAQPAAEGVPVVMTDVETAELVKVSANAFLAVRLSLVNGLAEVGEATGADVVALVRALAGDSRIGSRFLAPGLGYGGGCLPKDIRAFAAAARQMGVESLAVMLAEVDAINLRCRARTVNLARQVAGGSLDGCRAGVLASLGIGVRGRSRRLTMNYRTTQEILAWAVPLLGAAPVTGLDGEADTLTAYRSPMHGCGPLIRGTATREEELANQRASVNDTGAADSEERIGDPDSGVVLAVAQVFGQDFCAAHRAGCLYDRRVPVRELEPLTRGQGRHQDRAGNVLDGEAAE
jgi:UDPglucose 6-dehydrogenase